MQCIYIYIYLYDLCMIYVWYVWYMYDICMIYVWYMIPTYPNQTLWMGNHMTCFSSRYRLMSNSCSISWGIFAWWLRPNDWKLHDNSRTGSWRSNKRYSKSGLNRSQDSTPSKWRKTVIVESMSMGEAHDHKSCLKNMGIIPPIKIITHIFTFF